ncbi:MAG: ribonuclease E/G [Rhodospirillaceae bacterium]|nr:ribonuclease E/G [Rhodospirillaceae bacterium]
MSNKKMLIDAAHPEETRVVVLDGNQLEDFDVEVASRRQLKGNIYLAKVIRVEPSLQAAFVDYGGNRHGFLAFSEIHPDYYQIPVADREALATAEAEAREKEMLAHEEAVDAEDSAVLETAGDETEETPENEIDSSDSNTIEAGADVDTIEEDSAEITEGSIDASSEGEESADGIEATAQSDDDKTKEVTKTVEILGGDETEELRPRRKTPDFRQYKIQEVIKRRQVILVQVVKEERGNKGAALTTYLSLAGRYCVLMPNTARGGGISRKITNSKDRKQLKSILNELEIPDGMAVILRTAGIGRTKTEIKRDFENLEKLWNGVRDTTLKSTAPTLVHEEGDVIRRTLRDLYTRDIEEVIVEGDEAYRTAKDFMKLLIPSHARRIKQYKDSEISLFRNYGVENQMDAAHNPVVTMKSGGYIVINPTEALVSIDVNSGRSTKERNIEETALKTNIEAAVEVARQLRLRDLAGLIVIDFIDMDLNRNNITVERKLKEALKFDRARIQVGRISPFGLLEMSRQRMRPSLLETSSEPCPYCAGTGVRRSTESTALVVLRAIEEEGGNHRASEITVHVPTSVALYILNQKREAIAELEAKYKIRALLSNDDSLVPPDLRLERTKNIEGEAISEMVATRREEGTTEEAPKRRRRRRGRKSGANDGDFSDANEADEKLETGSEQPSVSEADSESTDVVDGEERPKRRRRSRGGRRRRRSFDGEENSEKTDANASATATDDVQPAEPATDDAAKANSADTNDRPRRRRGRNRKPSSLNAKTDDAPDGKTATESKPEPDETAAVVKKPAVVKKKAAPRKKVAKKSDSDEKQESTTETKPAPDPVVTAKEEGPKKTGWWQLGK